MRGAITGDHAVTRPSTHLSKKSKMRTNGWTHLLTLLQTLKTLMKSLYDTSAWTTLLWTSGTVHAQMIHFRKFGLTLLSALPKSLRSNKMKEKDRTNCTTRIPQISGRLSGRSWMLPQITIMGSCNRYETRIWTPILQILQLNSRRTWTTGRIYQRKLEERIHSTLEITNGITLLLHFEERWTTTTNTRLSVPQSMDNQKCSSPSFNLGHYGQDQSFWSQILHQIWHTMRLQQCQD